MVFLKFPLAIEHLLNSNESPAFPPGQKPYYLSKEAISQVTEILLGACTNLNTANPAAFLWGVVLQSLKEGGEAIRTKQEQEQTNAGPSGRLEPAVLEDLLDCARTPKHTAEDAIFVLKSPELIESVLSVVVTLSIKAGSMSAIDDILTDQWVRLPLFDIVKVALDRIDYTPEVLESTLAILTGTPDSLRWDKATSLCPASDPRSVFVKSPYLMAGIFELARSRFPYETVPFLRLCRALVTPHEVNEDGLPLIIEELDNMSTFTQIVSPGFQGYETIREDENANWVSLIQSLPMFESASRNLLPETQTSNALIVSGSSEIPTSTVGQVISESKPAIIMWQHRYSCLSFLGSWLEEWSTSGGYSSDWSAAPCTEIIELLADLVAGARDAHAHDAAGTGATRILEMASDGLSRQGDIISVVLDIFERNLQNIGSRGDPANALDPIMACLRFIQEVIKILPSRVWPFFSRSSFIGSDGKGGVMTAIVSAMELPSGEYPFLLSCMNLLVAAIDDAASRAVLRKSPGSVAGKSTIASDWSAGIPSHVMRTILLNFTRTMVEIFNSNGNWRFNLPEQQFKLNAMLATALDRILYYAYGVNDSATPEAKVTGVFSDSAAYILDLLRPRSTADLPFSPLLRLISDGLQTPPTVHLRYLALVENQVNGTLGLCIKLVQAARLTEQPGSLLEEQLFKATPVLIKLYALHDAYRLPVVSLLEILISVAASDPDNEPPSLVGHLGAESSCLFLDVLSQLDKPLNDETLLLANWKLLSTFVSKRQQWLAVFILTGASPRQTLKKSSKSGDPSMRGVPFLQMALDKLANIDQEEPQVALALLEFVSRAQENWPWATPHLKKHSQFFNSIVSYVSKLKISSLPVIQQIYATRIAAVVADICAVYLHAAKEIGDFSFVKTLIPLVQWYSKDAVEVDAYNASLHANLKKNFEMRYAGCKIVDFKRTPLVPRALGRDYYYDLRMGEKLLSYDFAWAGSRNRGFSEEFERANINLSLVEAQVVSNSFILSSFNPTNALADPSQQLEVFCHRALRRLHARYCNSKVDGRRGSKLPRGQHAQRPSRGHF
jgi:nuclear pore complex protein Nup188